MKLPRLLPHVLATLTLGLSLQAQAQFAKPDDAIKYRQGALAVMGNHFARLGAMAQGRIPFDAQEAQRHADVVAFMAPLPWAAFGEGTDKGAPTRAKAEIWFEKDTFTGRAEQMQKEATALAAAARTGDLAQVRTAFGSTAQSCRACHDAYRD